MPELTVDSVRLTYEVRGSGEPVLFICGTGQPAFSWDIYHVPAVTSAGFKAITFDNRGMPPSDAPDPPYSVEAMVGDTIGLIEQLSIAPCRVVGYSLGAFITQELSLARPDLVRGAVMLGTFGRQDVFRRAMTNAWVDLDETGIELPRFYDAVYSSFSLFSPQSLNNEAAMNVYLEATTSLPAWSGPGKLGQHKADIDYDDRLGALTSVEVPALVIAFELDMVTPAHLGKEVSDAIPGCGYVEVGAAGHAGPFEKPNEVTKAYLDFLGTL